MKVFAVLSVCLLAGSLSAQERANPYRCEGDAAEAGGKLPLNEIRKLADGLAKRKDSRSLCTAAELYKRLGDGKAHSLYEKAIGSAPDEPVYELLYGDYLRLYRGAGQRPLFQEAEKHLFAARGKLELQKPRPEWGQSTEDRIQRSLTALYERDGFQLARWTWKGEGSRAAVRRPWLFFSPGARWEQANNDFDQIGRASCRERV